MSNINTNTIKLMNAGGREKIIGDVPDLWHIAMAVSEGREIFLNQEASEVRHCLAQFRSSMYMRYTSTPPFSLNL